MRTLVAGLMVGLGFTLSACTPPAPAPADALAGDHNTMYRGVRYLRRAALH